MDRGKVMPGVKVIQQVVIVEDNCDPGKTACSLGQEAVSVFEAHERNHHHQLL